MGIWQDWFGAGQTTIWSEIARELDAHFTEGGFFSNQRLDLARERYNITLDTFVRGAEGANNSYMRMRAPFRNPKHVQFLIYREGFFSALGRLFGMQDITIGADVFDELFVIQGDPTSFVTSVLAEPRIRWLINRQSKVYLTIKSGNDWYSECYPEGIDELYFESNEASMSPASMKRLFELFIAIIDQIETLEPSCEFGINI